MCRSFSSPAPANYSVAHANQVLAMSYIGLDGIRQCPTVTAPKFGFRVRNSLGQSALGSLH